MSKRNWQRTVAALFAGGTIVGGWLGLAIGQPMPSARVENAVWSRAATPVPDPVTPIAAAQPFSTPPPPIAKPNRVVPIAKNEAIVITEFKAAPLPPPVTTIPTPPIPPAAGGSPRPLPPAFTPPILPAPPTQPANSARPVQPVPPAIPDFNLRPEDAGNSVKPYGSRPKGIGPMPPTDKYVFPLPAADAIPAVPTTIVKSPVVAPERPANPMAATIVRPTVPELPAVPMIAAGPMENAIHPTTNPTPGADLMTMKQTTIAAMLGGALGMMQAAPAPALPLPPRPLTALTVPTVPVSADPPNKASIEERLSKIEDDLKEIKELLQGRRDAQGYSVPSNPGLIKDVQKLTNDLARLKSDIAANKSTSLKPAPVAPPAKNAFTTGKGIVRIQNGYPVEITIAINGTTYRVPPSTQQDVFVPVGEFSYQLLNSGANPTPVKGPIGEKEVVKLVIK